MRQYFVLSRITPCLHNSPYTYHRVPISVDPVRWSNSSASGRRTAVCVLVSGEADGDVTLEEG